MAALLATANRDAQGAGGMTRADHEKQTRRHLVLNAGSSSLKFGVPRAAANVVELDPGLRQISESAAAPASKPRAPIVVRLANIAGMTKESACRDTPFQYVLDWVNGTLIGDEIARSAIGSCTADSASAKPMRVTPTLLDELDRLVPLAPLHQPHNLAPIRILAQKFPELAQVACFDTAFHSTQPAIARSYALPRALTDEGICSYGFHGLSYDYVTSRLMERQPSWRMGGSSSAI